MDDNCSSCPNNYYCKTFSEYGVIDGCSGYKEKRVPTILDFLEEDLKKYI